MRTTLSQISMAHLASLTPLLSAALFNFTHPPALISFLKIYNKYFKI